METTPKAVQNHRFTLRGMVIAVAALAVSCAAVCTSDFTQAVILGLVTLLIGPFFLARFGLWLFPVGPCPPEPCGTNPTASPPGMASNADELIKSKGDTLMKSQIMIVWVSVAALGFAGTLAAQEPTRADPARSGNEAAPAEAPAGKADAKPEPAGKAEHKLARATFGGGCFWCSEAVFERLKGVKSVVSGYAGGRVPNPTYEMVGSGLTGHAEVVQIEYDPDVVSYETLLKVFWATHDPTTLNRQGPDFGTQYRSIILYHDEDQKAAARKMFETLTASGTYRSPIVTELVPFEAFYPAERYHQNYYRTHRGAQYSEVYITPKIKKLQKLKLK